MRKKPDGLAWFTKPEIAIKQRVKDHYRNEKEKEHRKVLEHVDYLRSKYEQQVGYTLDQINSCLDVLTTDDGDNNDDVIVNENEDFVTPKPMDTTEGGIII